MKELFWKQQYDKRRKMLKSNLYDVLHTLDQQQLQDEIKCKAKKSILNFVNTNNISKQRLDEIHEFIYPILIECFNELIDICRQKNIVLHFVNLPTGLQIKEYQDVPYVVRTQLYQKQDFIKWLEQQQQRNQGFKQIFFYEFLLIIRSTQEEKKKQVFPDINTIQLNRIVPCIRYYGSPNQFQFTTQQPKEDVVESMKLNLNKNWEQKLAKMQDNDPYKQHQIINNIAHNIVYNILREQKI